MAKIKLLAELKGHHDRTWQISWHRSGQFLCSCSGDRTVRIWQLDNLGARGLSALPQPLPVPSTEVDETKPVPVDHPLVWHCLDVLEGVHKRTVRGVAFSPVGDDIATASFDGTTGMWEPRNRSLTSFISSSPVTSTMNLDANSPPAPPTSSTSLTGGSSTWSGAAGQDGNDDGDNSSPSRPGYECVAPLEGHENEVKSVAWSHTGNLLATCSRDKSVWIWEVLGDGDFECVSILQEHTQDVKMVLWHPTLDILASASYDDTIRIWRDDDDDWYCSATLSGHTSTVWALDFNAAGDHLVSVSDDQTMKFWRCESPHELTSTGATLRFRQDPTWKCVATLANHHTRCIYSVSWSKIHGLVASSSGDNSICIFAPKSKGEGELEFGLKDRITAAHGISDINCVQWNPSPDYADILASAGDDGVIRIWQVTDVE
ncbi:Cytosolic iron-sulfur protein assembly protein [Dimargaris cristalligena]|nr:Cytosolic iron-sulfur protein assembly protein [Dimargaris cristalligena]